MSSGGSDLLHLRRLTWDAIESQVPPTAERLARELPQGEKAEGKTLDDYHIQAETGPDGELIDVLDSNPDTEPHRRGVGKAGKLPAAEPRPGPTGISFSLE